MEWTTGVSAHRASFIQHCVNGQCVPVEGYPERVGHHIFMNRLAPGMRHTASEQCDTYLLKATVIPWQLCEDWVRREPV